MASEIWIIPFFGQGHLFPCFELCKHLSTRNFKAILVISSNLLSSIPSSVSQYPLVQIIEIPSPLPPPPQPGADPLRQHHHHHAQMALGIENLLSNRPDNRESCRPVCAILDVMMGWSSEIFKKFDVPTVAFFTSGASSAALEYAMWKAHAEDLKPGEIRSLPGLPGEMALTYSDLQRRPHGEGPPGKGAGLPTPPVGPGPRKMGPPKPGDRPPWVNDCVYVIALLINTCDDLERPFIQYIAQHVGKPVWGVGPLMPEQYWKSSGSILHDQEIRTNRRSNFTEDEVKQWLDSKPCRSVMYVSFGTEVGPKMEEYPELDAALEASTQSFIWVIQPGSGRSGLPRVLLSIKPDSESDDSLKAEEGYFPNGLDSKVGSRGLIIYGWAPQLLILSHPSTGGFLSHCGWNSTVEAIGRGVPLLAWPIRGDQYYDAKLVVNHLKVGHMICDDLSKMIKKDDISKGIERLMSDEDVKQQAVILSAKFQHGFPATSLAALDAFRDFINFKRNN